MTFCHMRSEREMLLETEGGDEINDYLQLDVNTRLIEARTKLINLIVDTDTLIQDLQHRRT